MSGGVVAGASAAVLFSFLWMLLAIRVTDRRRRKARREARAVHPTSGGVVDR